MIYTGTGVAAIAGVCRNSGRGGLSGVELKNARVLQFVKPGVLICGGEGVDPRQEDGEQLYEFLFFYGFSHKVTASRSQRIVLVVVVVGFE